MERKLLLFIVLFFTFSNVTNAQESKDSTDTQNFTLSVDLASNYIWRGLVYSDAPNLQPYLAFTNNKGNFSVGAWGSYSLSEFYSEVDMFASFSVSNFTFTVWDYFIMGPDSIANNRYFDYKDKTTGHALEGMLTFNGPESFPIQLIASTFFYGADRDAQGDNYYSTYFEASYPFKWKANNLRFFIGMSPAEGLYVDDLAVNNIGITNRREIKINDRFSIPISGSIIINPNRENIYFVIAINLSAND